eukprot:12899510-Prorocentrum_lima.AAC.1
MQSKAEFRRMCVDSGVWVYVLDNCHDTPDKTPWVQSVSQFLDTQPKGYVGGRTGQTSAVHERNYKTFT